MMEAARTSETSVDIDLRTWQYIPEDSELQDKLGRHTVMTSVTSDWGNDRTSGPCFALLRANRDNRMIRNDKFITILLDIC
jgi:hypothetical protein